MVIILMGVSGCGKSTLGELLSAESGLPFYDADDFHPESNVDKMRRGESLDDHDRMPWLHLLAEKIAEWNRGKGAILACSALKEKYRAQLRQGVAEGLSGKADGMDEGVTFVYLKGTKELISSRLRGRKGHYMPPELLDSQFDDLEEPDDALVVDIDRKPEAIMNEILMQLNRVDDHPARQ